MWAGFVVGMVLPACTTYLLYAVAYHGHLSFAEFLNAILDMKNMSRLLAVSALPNLIVFLIAINLDRLLAARGIVMATLAQAILVVIFKFFFV